jgi:hypothetical protein
LSPGAWVGAGILISYYNPMRKHKPWMPLLFDIGEPKKLDIEEGRKNMNAGIKQAVKHADEEVKDWSDRAYAFLLNFLANHNGTFMAEEVRVSAELMGLPDPPTKRAWGGVMLRAKYKDLIWKCGTRPVKNPDANCANASVWMPKKTG